MFRDFQKLMLVTQRGHQSVSSYLDFISTCCAAGITAVQLREKNSDFSQLKRFALSLKDVLKPYNIPLFVNDHLELALAVDADGLHLGQADGDPEMARKILGPDKLLGLSVESLADVEQANELPVDYIGVGAVFETSTKPDVKTVWGLTGLAKACNLSSHPVIAIGGITIKNAASVLAAGAQGLAAASALHAANDPVAVTQVLLKKFDYV